MKIFMLSLPRDVGRREKTLETFRTASGDGDIQIVDGVLPSDMPDFEEKLGLSATKEVGTRSLTNGEVGCIAGHLKMLEEFIESGEQYGLLIEDDLKIPMEYNHPHIISTLFDLVKSLPDFTFMNAGKAIARMRKEKPGQFFKTNLFYDDNLNNPLEALRTFNMTMGATVNVWTRYAAIAFIERTDLHFHVPWDDAIGIFIDAYGGGYTLKGKPHIFAVQNSSKTPSAIDSVDVETESAITRPRFYMTYQKSITEVIKPEIERHRKDWIESPNFVMPATPKASNTTTSDLF